MIFMFLAIMTRWSLVRNIDHVNDDYIPLAECDNFKLESDYEKWCRVSFFCLYKYQQYTLLYKKGKFKSKIPLINNLPTEYVTEQTEL